MRDFFKGFRMFGQGLGILLRSPRLLLIGALPALLTTLSLVGGVVALAFWIDDLSLLLTPFADDWSPGWRTTIRVAAGVAVFGVALAIAMIGFTAITLAVGGPFYEHIAEKVEDDLGGVPGAVDLSWWRLLVMGLKDGLSLVLRSLMFTIPLLIAGFIPVVGQTVVPVLLALVTAWFLALELIAVPFYRRGMGLKQRRTLLRRHRALALGLGLPVSLLCLIPFAALIVMPMGFVGGVLVAREVLSPAS
ncbi:EI24 domain-containing protein [Amycolatopsis decaplanina]|uniref:Protein involved in cysteine biosynthesis n=1 Tax=Amycolatopsis decaplanina DSM 44594 TaxID=1284240 RepID=M2Z8E6_9PSEU|nr:EI24 domain-containing protein [Amycolatopsis decaplanina]EME63547.1 protein involved in cysteine biosynthesis [Amycolatopsis decaplanina DSM 44594]